MWRRFLLAGLILGTIVFFMFPGILKNQIQKAIEKALPGSEIKLGRVVLGPDLSLEIYDPVIVLHKLPEMSSKKSGPARLPVRTVRVHGLVLDCRAGDLTAEIRGDLSYDARAGRLTKLSLTMPSFKRGKLSVENAALDAGPDGMGSLTAALVTQQKLKVSKIKARVTLGSDSLKLSNLEAMLADGNVTGSAELLFAPVGYKADLAIASMDLSILTTQLGLEAKVGLAGRVDGQVALSGDLEGVRQLTGKLNGTGRGGDVVIRDKETMERIAANVKQPIEIVEAAFKEYHFDTGLAGLRLEGDDLGLDVHLEGEKGKRDLEVNLHDFL